MIPLRKNQFWLNALMVVLGASILIGAWMFLAGAFYLQLSGQQFTAAQPLTFYQYWYYYNDLPEVHKKLLLSAGLAFFTLLLPIILIFKPKKKTLHGDARFASKNEISRAGLMGDTGIIVGKVGRHFLLYAGAMHAILCAPTRSGKGISTVLTNCLNWSQSLVVLDTKQEAFNFTSGYRKKYGQACYLFNPMPKDYRTHRWNPLFYISEDPNFRISDIQKIASFLFPDIEGQDPIWTSSGRSLFLGTVLYLLETPNKPVTLGEVLRTVTQVEEAGKFFSRIIQERIAEGKPLSATCTNALSDFIGTSDNTRTSIRKTFSSRFELLYNPLVDAAMSGNDFDLRDIRKKKMSIYIGVKPNDLDLMSPILNLFFQQLIDLNTQDLPLNNPDLKYETLLILDEFTNIGKLPSLAKGVSYVAGYGLKLLAIIQDYSQLCSVYGKDAAQTFSTNLGLQIDFAPKEQERADEISKMLGDQTWRVKSWGKTFGGKRGRSENQSDQRRALMLPQEVKQVGMWKQFIFMENMLPILCEKIQYYSEPIFINRLKEISPSLNSLGKKLPSKAELDQASGTAELSAKIPRIDVIQSKNYAPPPFLNHGNITERKLVPSDIDRLASLKAEDFICDFSDIVLPNDPPTEAELKTGVDDLLERFGMTA